MADFDFQIEYRPGQKQGHCDALSQCPTPRDCHCADIEMLEPLKCGPCRKCLNHAEQMLLSKPELLKENLTTHNQEHIVIEEPNRVGAVQEIPSTSTSEKQQTSKNVPSWVFVLSQEQIQEEQKKDPNISPLLTAKIVGEKPQSSDLIT